MSSYAKMRPCSSCRRRDCSEMNCEKWQLWFLESWAAVNRYAWSQRDAQGREEPQHFLYELPHRIKSPCADCPSQRWCDTPCSLRLKWWDCRMDVLRRKGLGHAAR